MDQNSQNNIKMKSKTSADDECSTSESTPEVHKFL